MFYIYIEVISIRLYCRSLKVRTLDVASVKNLKESFVAKKFCHQKSLQVSSSNNSNNSNNSNKLNKLNKPRLNIHSQPKIFRQSLSFSSQPGRQILNRVHLICSFKSSQPNQTTKQVFYKQILFNPDQPKLIGCKLSVSQPDKYFTRKYFYQ